MSPTGRKIHEDVFKLAQFQKPVRIGILETPTGFEVNALHSWPERMQVFFETSLRNFQPQVTRIRAWQRTGKFSTNDPAIVDQILNQDYLYAGAGSPTYTVVQLNNSLAWKRLLEAHEAGSVLSVGSATAVAMSRYTLPVYEIFKAGFDLHWIKGLDFFGKWGLHFTVIPHWNNQEGEDFDTTCCWMGKERFSRLIKLLPEPVPILGIDEQTALLIDLTNSKLQVMGIGTITIIHNNQEKVYKCGEAIDLQLLK